MSTDADGSNRTSSLLIGLETQLRQVALETQYNQVTIKTTQENLNISLKHNILLEQELETERLNKSMIQMELDSLKSTMNESNNRSSNNSELTINVLLEERNHLTDTIYKIQMENIKLKQTLSKLNGKISTLMANEYQYTEKINLITSTMNSVKVHINKLTEESNTIVNLITNSKILVKKMLCALEYSKNVNKTQLDNLQHIIQEVASIKSKIHMFMNQNEKQKIKNTDQPSTILSNQTHLEIYMALVGTLETENYVLLKSVEQMTEKLTLKNHTMDNTDKYTE